VGWLRLWFYEKLKNKVHKIFFKIFLNPITIHPTPTPHENAIQVFPTKIFQKSSCFTRIRKRIGGDSHTINTGGNEEEAATAAADNKETKGNSEQEQREQQEEER